MKMKETTTTTIELSAISTLSDMYKATTMGFKVTTPSMTFQKTCYVVPNSKGSTMRWDATNQVVIIEGEGKTLLVPSSQIASMVPL